MADNLTDHAAGQAASAPLGAQAGADCAAIATIGALLAHGRSLLGGGSDSAALEAQLLLSHVLGRPRSELTAHPERAVAPASARSYHALLTRAAAGEPLAYLTGTREFWSLPLTVTPAVLVPRPETELAVERCLALLTAAASRPPVAAGAATGPCRLCDLGTGSGAIALAVAREQPSWHITATDRSAAALSVARSNAGRLALRNLEFLHGDWFEPLSGRCFELIVSNPPYVAADDPAMAALTHEPSEALSPGPSGLEALEVLVERSPAYLVHGGWLVLEHGADQGGAVMRMLVARGYACAVCHQDLAGRDRVTEARWP